MTSSAIVTISLKSLFVCLRTLFDVSEPNDCSIQNAEPRGGRAGYLAGRMGRSTQAQPAESVLHHTRLAKDTDAPLSSDAVATTSFLTTDDTFLYGRTSTLLWRTKKSGGRVFPFAWTRVDAFARSFIVDNGHREASTDWPRPTSSRKPPYCSLVLLCGTAAFNAHGATIRRWRGTLGECASRVSASFSSLLSAWPP